MMRTMMLDRGVVSGTIFFLVLVAPTADPEPPKIDTHRNATNCRRICALEQDIRSKRSKRVSCGGRP